MHVDIKYSLNYYDEERNMFNEVKRGSSSLFLEKLCFNFALAGVAQLVGLSSHTQKG